MKFTSYGKTDVGMKRKTNQDAFLTDDALALYVVADGMGGHQGGEVASRLAIESLLQFCQNNSSLSGREVVEKGVQQACQKIFATAQSRVELSGMGTTVTSLLIRDETAFIAQVGDSRMYLLNANGIWQVTEDHSLVNEEVRAGRLSREKVNEFQFKNIITRSVGYEAQVVVDLYQRKISSKEIYFLCSDGLSGLVSIDEIYESIQSKGLREGIDALIMLANLRGGDDNITAVVCQVEG